MARRFGLGGKGREKETLERVGASIGLTRERIRQVEMKARNKLRLFMEQREEYVQRQAEKA
jgi:RNA polymerase nonessential primary-like sigma factor